jgi:hypothetical protein
MTYKEYDDIFLESSGMPCKENWTELIFSTEDNHVEFEYETNDGSFFTVDWGDGSLIQQYIYLVHDYSNTELKTITFFISNPLSLIKFNGSDNTLVLEVPSFSEFTSLEICDMTRESFSGELPSFSNCTQLTVFGFDSVQLSGELPDFSACTQLEWFSCYGNYFSGTIPSFANCTKLKSFLISNNMFTEYTGGCLATQRDLELIGLSLNYLTQDSIDAALEDCVTSLGISGRVIANLSLVGPNMETPSAAGYANKEILEAAGWSVYTN